MPETNTDRSAGIPDALAHKLLDLVGAKWRCPECNSTLHSDPAPVIEIDVDPEDGDYGEGGWYPSPTAEAYLRCTATITDTDSPFHGQTCNRRTGLDLQETLAIAADLLTATLVGAARANPQ